MAAAVSELERKTTSPPASAALERVTVPVEPAPPATVEGESERPVGVGGGGAALPSTVIVAVREMPLAEAVMVVVRVVGPARVEIGKVPLLRWTVIVAGTVAAAVFELESETTRPPAGAPTERKTVPVTRAPPWTVAGRDAQGRWPDGRRRRRDRQRRAAGGPAEGAGDGRDVVRRDRRPCRR